MAYTPDPTDATQPVGTVPAGTADEEFRALKAYIKGIVAGTLQQGPSRRQCVVSGVRDANGAANFLSAGAGLNLNVLATADPMILNYAQGSVAAGDLNVGEVVTADAAMVLLPQTWPMIYKDYQGSFDWNYARPQYGYFYTRTRQALLNFDGIVGSTSMIDDYGNTWTTTGAAKLQSNWVKFGATALGGGGANNAMDGGSDSIQSSDFKFVNQEAGTGWTIRGWARPTQLPGAGAFRTFVSAANGADYGVFVGIYNNAGTIRWAVSLSSNGTSADIASLAIGTSVPAINTDYFIEVTYDAATNAYRMYINGVAEWALASGTPICLITGIRIGALRSGNAASFWAGYIDGFEFLPYCDHPGNTAYAVPTAAKSVTDARYSADYFDIGRMVMNKITGPSTVAGTNPAMTPVNRVYVGEVITSAVAITSTYSYAFKGQYTTPPAGISGTATNVYVHNLGLVPTRVQVLAKCVSPDNGYNPGETINISSVDNGSVAWTIWSNWRAVVVSTTNSAPGIVNKNNNTRVAWNFNANWNAYAIVDRGW